MNALIVVEASCGNAIEVAQAIEDGVSLAVDEDQVEIISLDEAPTEIPSDVTLLVVGSPTTPSWHQHSGQHDAEPEDGVRKWIAALDPHPDLEVMVFDTRPKHGLGSAAKVTEKALRARGFVGTCRGESFWVKGNAGPLQAGEADRAAAWGRRLGVAMAARY